MDAYGLGFRVPMIVVSPYARRGVVSHTVREHSSIDKFIETTYGLPAMTARDAAADDLSDTLDLTQSPRPYTDFVQGMAGTGGVASTGSSSTSTSTTSSNTTSGTTGTATGSTAH